MSSEPGHYIPGVCNIGRAEIRLRKIVAGIGLATTVFLLGVFALVPVSPWGKLGIFVPATLMAAGFLQAYWGFCARFGLQGVFNFGGDLSQRETIEQAEARRADRRTALAIIALSLLIGAGVTGLAMLI